MFTCDFLEPIQSEFSYKEFMVLADAGEDEVLYTEDSKYAANVEKAVSLPPDAIASPFNSCEKNCSF